jgi:hypothetical protein
VLKNQNRGRAGPALPRLLTNVTLPEFAGANNGAQGNPALPRRSMGWRMIRRRQARRIAEMGDLEDVRGRV